MNKPTGTIHICLVSRQPVPNLTPLIDPQFKPRKVIMLVSYLDMGDHNYKRAQDLNIDICANTELKKLHPHLNDFIH